MKHIAVFISGGGTNLQALMDACDTRQIDAAITLVVSSRADAYGLVRAGRAHIPTLTVPLRHWKQRGLDRAQYDRDLANLIQPWRVDLVVLAGWMLVLGPHFLEGVGAQVINLHPALPGMFPGTHAIQRAWDSFQRGEIQHTGVMVHEVIPEVDAGPVLGSRQVPILAADTLETLETRIHQAEHDLLVQTVASLTHQPEVLE